MTQEKIDRLAAALGVQRHGMNDDQLFEACLRAIERNMNVAL